MKMKHSEEEYDIIDYVLDTFDINTIPYGERLEHYVDYNDGCILYHVIVPHNPLTESVDEENSLAVKEVFDKLKHYYKIANWQMKVISPFKVEIPIAECKYKAISNVMIIPSIKENLQIITKEMNNAGYYCSKYQSLKDNDGMMWIIVQFNPYKQDDINNNLLRREMIMYLYHCSPVKFENEILTKGLIPKNDSSVYKYPPRTFLKIGDDDMKDYYRLMREISSTHPEYNGKYVMFTISVEKVIDSVKFYLDPNAKDCCYTTDIINSDAIIDKHYKDFNFA